ncbi:flavin monoamine oxidase family protein [Massilia cavernae]|uniref:FAD-dependent oxidoreductase n=1 Tax=Massilia cavernae TaxID=2320864 RepID=A0A418X6Z8_9BURK|nr:NAD(P)/FAD-dependent oxidoreductase [Massilia cavernae]RJG08266.1 FAD-dependent oxidoreductase [Massilia cavernae]
MSEQPQLLRDGGRVAVVGAGMAGLTAAYRVLQGGGTPVVFEADDSVGGRTNTTEKQGYIIDSGAILLSPRYKRTMALIKDLRLGPQFVASRPVLSIVRDGVVHEIDLARPMVSFLRSAVLSGRAKLALVRLLPDLLRYWQRCHFRSMGELAALDHETCRSYALRVLGQELHDYLVEPLIRVNMFTSSDRACAADLIWLLRIFSHPVVMQSRGGMQVLPSALAGKLDVRLNSPVSRVTNEGQGVMLAFGEGQTARFDAAIIAVPPPVALAIAPWISGPRRAFFSAARPVRSVAVSLGLSRIPEGKSSMIMVPSLEQTDLLAIVFSHRKSADRAPKGKGLVTLHMRHAWAERVAGDSNEAVARQAMEAARPILGDLAPLVEMVHVKHWQYVDSERKTGCYHALARMLEQPPEHRVCFAGEYISAGVEGAVISGENAAATVLRWQRG